jgi:hypothetical protein
LKPDIREGHGWFEAYWNDTRIGRFDSYEGAEKAWQRWERTHAGGVVQRAQKFTAYPKAAP